MVYILVHAILFGVLFLLDRITKLYALINCTVSQEIMQGVSCDLVFNRGVSWGLFHSYETVPFYMVTGVVLMITVFLGIYIVPLCVRKIGYDTVGGIMIFAGSISNIYDRFMYDGVIDFIRLYYNDYSFPVFNIADVCIVIGIALFVWGSYE